MAQDLEPPAARARDQASHRIQRLAAGQARDRVQDRDPDQAAVQVSDRAVENRLLSKHSRSRSHPRIVALCLSSSLTLSSFISIWFSPCYCCSGVAFSSGVSGALYPLISKPMTLSISRPKAVPGMEASFSGVF